MAEREGFEPPEGLHLQWFSRPLPGVLRSAHAILGLAQPDESRVTSRGFLVKYDLLEFYVIGRPNYPNVKETRFGYLDCDPRSERQGLGNIAPFCLGLKVVL